MNENELYPNQPVQPGIAISPEVNPGPVPPRKRHWKIPVIIAAIIVIVGGAAGFGYANGYSIKGFSLLTPTKVWDNFYAGDSGKIYTATFNADYSDPDSLDESQDEFGIILKNIKVQVEGSNYSNLTDPNKPAIDGNLKFTLASGNSSFSSGIDYRALDGNVFYKVGDIPFLSGLLGSENKDKDWVKINIEKAKSQSTEESDFLQGVTDTALQDKIRKIWVDTRAIKLDKYVGRETINGTSTLHFRAVLDKESTKKAVVETITQLATLDKTKSFTADDQTLLNNAIAKLVDKVEIQELDVWVGVKDHNLYKLHLVSNAPSVVSLVKLASTENQDLPADATLAQKQAEVDTFIDKLNFSATFKLDATYSNYGQTKKLEEPAGAVDLLGKMEENSSDARRTADVRQLAAALELYFNDNSRYAATLQDLVPTVIGVIPTAPTPPGGTCTEAQNSYTYSLIDATHYKLTFCLGGAIGGYTAGPHTLSEAGIN
jgi:hypothetical protein